MSDQAQTVETTGQTYRDSTGQEHHHTNILILGGGFAGVYTAMYLEKFMSADERRKISITLVSRENYLVFQPMLPEVISGTIDMLHVICPIRQLIKRTFLHVREIEDIDIVNKTVRLAPGLRPKHVIVHYDQLVIGLGTILDCSKIPGMAEHAIPFKYLGDALYLRNHLVRVMEESEIERDPVEKKKLLTFVVGGGGFSGVECVAEMNDFLREADKYYPGFTGKDLKVVLLQSDSRILPELEAKLAQFAHGILQKRGVEIRLNTYLKAVSANEVTIQDKITKQLERIPTRTVVATVPSGPHPLVTRLPCKVERGKIVSSNTMDVPGWEGLWALGDCALVPQKDGIMSPPTAQHALRQASTCAKNILAGIRGQAKKPFLFTGLGKLGSLGHRAAVAEVMGIKLSGWLAWMLWRAIYVSKFPGFERKIRIQVDWFLNIFLPKDVTELRIFPDHEVSQEHFEAGETVFDDGDFGDKIYFIAKGEVEIVKNNKILATLRDTDLFGEIALISDKPRAAGVRAKTAVDVVVVSRGAFKKILAHVPGVRKIMEGIMSTHLGRQVDLIKEIVSS